MVSDSEMERLRIAIQRLMADNEQKVRFQIVDIIWIYNYLLQACLNFRTVRLPP